jgi:hypothetical protein
MWLQEEEKPQDRQSEEEAVSGGMSARCSDVCDPSKVCIHWALLDQSSVMVHYGE